jgi:hypothetical protein
MTSHGEDKLDDINNQSSWPLLPGMRELIDASGLVGHALLHPSEACKSFAPTLNQWSAGLLGKTVAPMEKYSPDLAGKVIFVTGGG